MSTDIVVPAILFLCMVVLHVMRVRHLDPLKRFSGDEYELGAASTLGTRTIQQDYFGVKKNSGVLLMLLADGIRDNGEIAAKLAVDTFRDLFDDPNSIQKPQYFFKRAANTTQRKIDNTLEERQGETSIAAVMVKGYELFYSLIGSCRVTVFRGGDLIPVSEGQTLDVLAKHRYQEGRISKQETLALLDRHRRYNVLGQDSFQEVEVFSKPLSLKNDDMIVLMSEGVLNTLRWVEIEEVLSKRESVQDLAEEIIRLVNNSPMVDKDNASVLICRRK
ncbi:MAG: protein phosphatase 2C domain-containing protein [Selenomonadaceae bacterium]|nr:protein phosphatase 2C domain-containing protein [Selenomonadaceae bacterium]